MPNKVGFSEAEISKFLEGIYYGHITPYRLPKNLYNATAKLLMRGMLEGARSAGYKAKPGPRNAPKKGIKVSFGATDKKLVKELKENVYMFSAAKTFQQVKDIGGSLIGADGKIVPFKEFNEKGREQFENWNSNYAETEYNTSISQARTAVKWNRVEANKDVLPFLRYSAVMDDNTTPECAELNDTVAPVDDPIWDTCTPPNHFNCRCTFLQEDDSVTPDPPEDIEEITEKAESTMDDVFKMNPGKDKVIFNADHPYFEVEDKYRSLAERNFDLEIPDEE